MACGKIYIIYIYIYTLPLLIFRKIFSPDSTTANIKTKRQKREIRFIIPQANITAAVIIDD